MDFNDFSILGQGPLISQDYLEDPNWILMISSIFGQGPLISPD